MASEPKWNTPASLGSRTALPKTRRGTHAFSFLCNNYSGSYPMRINRSLPPHERALRPTEWLTAALRDAMIGRGER